MPTLYYTNASGDQNWETLANWNTAADGSGDNPTNIPWTDNGSGGSWYANYDLMFADGVADYLYINSSIGENEDISGVCSIGDQLGSYYLQNRASVYSGNFTTYAFGNQGFSGANGIIYGGTFYGDSFDNNSGIINGGTFLGIGNFNQGEINGGTFSGNGFTNGGTITGGIFSGNDFYNQSSIYGGLFSGDYFHNSSQIYAGTFSGITFDNASSGSIFDGAFTGVNFNNSGGTINGGEFSGYNFYNNSTIYGGAFSGDGFINAGNITGITFSGNGFTNQQGAQILNSHFRANSGFSDWSVSGCYFESDGTFSQDGKNYTYASEFVAVTYPQSGGGGGIDIARLLGLPFFVKI